MTLSTLCILHNICVFKHQPHKEIYYPICDVNKQAKALSGRSCSAQALRYSRVQPVPLEDCCFLSEVKLNPTTDKARMNFHTEKIMESPGLLSVPPNPNPRMTRQNLEQILPDPNRDRSSAPKLQGRPSPTPLPRGSWGLHLGVQRTHLAKRTAGHRSRLSRHPHADTRSFKRKTSGAHIHPREGVTCKNGGVRIRRDLNDPQIHNSTSNELSGSGILRQPGKLSMSDIY